MEFFKKMKVWHGTDNTEDNRLLCTHSPKKKSPNSFTVMEHLQKVLSNDSEAFRLSFKNKGFLSSFHPLKKSNVMAR